MNRMPPEGEAETSYNIQGARDAQMQCGHSPEAWGQSPYVPDSCDTCDQVNGACILLDV